MPAASALFLLSLCCLNSGAATTAGPRAPVRATQAGQTSVELQRPDKAALTKTAVEPTAAERKVLKSILREVARAHAKGDYAAASEALQRATRLARRWAPLEVSQLTVVQETPSGLGMLRPSPGGEVRGSTLRLYAEVRNFELRQVAGSYEVQLQTDAYFYYQDGAFIAGRQSIGEHRFRASTQHDVTFLAIELRTSGLPPQPYILELVITDRVSGKQGRAQVPFEVLSPG